MTFTTTTYLSDEFMKEFYDSLQENEKDFPNIETIVDEICFLIKKEVEK